MLLDLIRALTCSSFQETTFKRVYRNILNMPPRLLKSAMRKNGTVHMQDENKLRVYRSRLP